MAWSVNLLAAFLTLLAIAFYVVVYTLLLKRTTPQNIVIGGAAGALPPVIGWAAVTGSVEVPALLLFALVFYWTPPHFWALALRIRKDYEAAKVPMLPVVQRRPRDGAPDRAVHGAAGRASASCSTRSPAWAAIYLVAAVVLGGVFLWRASVLWRQATSPEGSLAQAIRLYKYSISYLTLLFVAVAVDALVVGRLLAARVDAPQRVPARRSDQPVPSATSVPTMSPTRSWLVAASCLVALALASSLVRPTSVLAACPTAPQPRRGRVLFGDVVFVGHRPAHRERRPLADRPGSRSAGRARHGLDDDRSFSPRRPGARHRDRDRSHVPARPLPVRRQERATASSRDDGCSGTQRAWTDELAPLRPPGVTPGERRSCPRTRWARSTRGRWPRVAGLLFAAPDRDRRVPVRAPRPSPAAGLDPLTPR